MKRKILLLIFLLCTFVFACKRADYPDDCSTYDYSGCNTKEPQTGNLEINLTINNENPSVLVTVYSGKYEDRVFLTDTLAKSAFITLPVTLNNYYSVTAKYELDGKTIMALDGNEIQKTSRTICDSTCWSVSGKDIDVRLKY